MDKTLTFIKFYNDCKKEGYNIFVNMSQDIFN